MKTLILVNPLPDALKHYERELLASLGDDIEVHIHHEQGEGLGLLGKLGLVKRRLFEPMPHTSAHLIVLWPLFGFLDPIFWLRAAKRGHVTMIVHDPRPLRRQMGMGRIARRLFAWQLKFGNIAVVTHTKLASLHLQTDTGVFARALRHPMLPQAGTPRIRHERTRITVLGQFKPARSLSLMQSLATTYDSSAYELVVVGRGWPPLPGWRVIDFFVSEERFDAEIAKSDVVCIPYHDYYQSGVAVRAIESGIPVVGLRHEFLELLCGDDWGGIAEHPQELPDAVEVAASASLDVISTMASNYVSACRAEWKAFLYATESAL